MVQINFSLKEVNCKIVYYGPGLSGKTTNLEIVHEKAPTKSVGELTSIATEGDRTLFFDFLPLNLGQVAVMKTKFQIYTVPGQVYYNSTRKLVLQGADGIVFVADSKRGKMEENIESLDDLVENMREYGMNVDEMPIVLQYNKRDLPETYSVAEMDESLNRWSAPTFEAVARDGAGVFPTLKHLAGMVLESLNNQHTPGRRKSVAIASGGGQSSTTAGVSMASMPSTGLATRTVQETSSLQTKPSAQARVGTVRPSTRAAPRPSVVTSPRRKRRKENAIWVGVALLAVAVAAAYVISSGIIHQLLP